MMQDSCSPKISSTAKYDIPSTTTMVLTSSRRHSPDQGLVKLAHTLDLPIISDYDSIRPLGGKKAKA